MLRQGPSLYRERVDSLIDVAAAVRSRSSLLIVIQPPSSLHSDLLAVWKLVAVASHVDVRRPISHIEEQQQNSYHKTAICHGL